MWILTGTGFVSVVRHREDRNRLLVRARDRDSLEAFCEAAGLPAETILVFDKADYRFRVVATDNELKRFLDCTVGGLEYDNFKSRVWQRRGARWHSALLEVWRTLRRQQDPITRRTT